MKLPVAVKEMFCSLSLLKEIIYPRTCAVCSSNIDDGCFCKVCRKNFLLRLHKHFSGSKDGLWKQNIVLMPEDVLTELMVLYKYDGALKEKLRSLKFTSDYNALPSLREELKLALPQRFDLWLRSFDYAACVPTSAERLEERGFDIPQELFRDAFAKSGCTYVPNLLVRVKRTAPLYSLNKEERRMELCGCFAVNPEYDVLGKNILLCDDIYTTGTTFAEAAAALLRAGAASVSAWAFAAAKENW